MQCVWAEADLSSELCLNEIQLYLMWRGQHEAGVFVDVRLLQALGPSFDILFYVPQQSRVSFCRWSLCGLNTALQLLTLVRQRSCWHTVLL